MKSKLYTIAVLSVLFFSTSFGQIILQTSADLPITFEDTVTINHAIVDFGGNASMIVTDPTNMGNLVVQSTKTDGSETWAGTVVADNGLVAPIPFTDTDTKISVRVWSPDANTPVLLKVEVAGMPEISVETLSNTTVASAWETLEFDFSIPSSGPALDLNNAYNKIVVFFNFGITGADAGEKTYYWDDVEFAGGGGVEPMLALPELPVMFEDTVTINHAIVDFGGNVSAIVTDPTNAENLVVQSTKTDGSETWAGTVVADNGLVAPIPFTETDTKMSVRVWSPDAGIPVLLKVEVVGTPELSVETLSNTTVAGAWETLEFDFSIPSAGPELDLNNAYNKVIIFFNFGITGADAGEKTYYWDDVDFAGGGGVEPMLALPELPVMFEDTVTIDHAIVDFGGNVSSIVTDPTDAENLVVQSTKTDGSETWAGTVVADNGLVAPIPFTETDTKMSVRVWSPDAGIPVLLKVEVAGTPELSVETLSNTTVAGAWETLEFNFSVPSAGPELDLNNAYNKVIIFFNFGITGADAGEKTYYWDDVEFNMPVFVPNLISSTSGIDLFPNPTKDFFRIQLKELVKKSGVMKLFDLQGKLIHTQVLDGTNTLISIEDLKDTLYFVSVTTDDKTYVEKLIVKK